MNDAVYRELLIFSARLDQSTVALRELIHALIDEQEVGSVSAITGVRKPAKRVKKTGQAEPDLPF